MKQIGPTRLILINCGKFDYAEINLDKPLHLVGPNNIGKTSLIAVLQFLYINNQNKMKFSSELDDTRKYYFPDNSSFALFESLGPEGFITLGVHGLGPVKKYDFERFSYQGKYSRDDYLSPENQILSWDHIKARLSNRNYANLKPSDVRAALMGNESRRRRNDLIPNNLSLVPLRRIDEYDRFCSVFLNLLRLAHLRQDELKELLLQLFEGYFTKARIDLHDDFAPQLKQLQDEKADASELEKHKTTIQRILENVSQRDELRGKLKYLYDCIRQDFNIYEEDTESKRIVIKEKMDECQSLIRQKELDRQELENQRDIENNHKGSLETIKGEIESLQDEFLNYNSDWINTSINELESSVRNIESQLHMAQNQSPDSIRRRLNQRELELRNLTKQLENIDCLLVTSLMEKLDQTQIDQLSRLFNDDILKLPAKGSNASAKIKNSKLLYHYLEDALEGFSGTTYTNNSISLNLQNVAHFDVNNYIDPERIRENINHHKKDIQNLRSALNAAENNLKLKQKLKGDKQRLNDLRSQQVKYSIYINKKNENHNLPQKLKDVGLKISKLLKDIQSLVDEHRRLSQQNRSLEDDRRVIDEKLVSIREKVSRLLLPGDDWKQVKYNVPKSSLDDMLYLYESLNSESERMSNIIDGEFTVIHSETYGRYQANSEKESLEMLKNELDALETKQKALEESWVSFIALLKKDFQELNRDMDMLISKVNTLNHNLSKVQISNLSNLKINVVARPELKVYFNQIEDSEQTPLFSATSQTNEAINKISAILKNRPFISLKDMFDMQFEITTPNGEIKKYDHLDRIESNGTTITIKVLINLILLRGLLSDDNVYMPFYLDECSSLDSENLRSIVEQARQQGFIAILASPEAMDAADNMYYLQENNGRVILNPHCLVEIVRDEMETANE